jgi:hypothetical protein
VHSRGDARSSSQRHCRFREPANFKNLVIIPIIASWINLGRSFSR